MFYKKKTASNRFFPVLLALMIIGIVITSSQLSQAVDIVTNDYFINHKSNR